MTAIPINDIRINEGRRQLDADKVAGLAESIADIGLLQPITVNADYSLIAGLHRLEAHKQLGLAYIEANVIDLSPIDAELAEIDENLIRNELTVMARGELLARRKAIYEQKHPETRAGVAGAEARHHATEIISFADDTAAKTGVTPRTIRQEVQIATDIAEDVRDALRDTDVADRKTDLLKLAKQDEDDQRTIASLIVEGEANTVKHAIDIIRERENVERERRDRANAGHCQPTIAIADAMEWMKRQEPADLLLTDPPYMTDVANITTFAQGWLPLALSKMKPTGRAYICIGAYPQEIAAYLSVAMPDQILVWTYRNTLGPSPKDNYKQNWQAILYYKGTDAGPLDCPEMLEQFSVQDISAPDGRQGDRYHAWQKPGELAERFIRHATKSGDTVLDPFSGTGTFVLAAANLGRIGIGCELSQDNAEIARERGCLITETI